MRRATLTITLLLMSGAALGQDSVVRSASRFIPHVSWRAKSILRADFTCTGHIQTAVLGTTPSEIVIAIFLNGLNRKPEQLRYSARVRNAQTAELKIEDLNFGELEDMGIPLPGYKPLTTCKGLNLSDGEIDSAHIYWDDKDHQFYAWSL